MATQSNCCPKRPAFDPKKTPQPRLTGVKHGLHLIPKRAGKRLPRRLPRRSQQDPPSAAAAALEGPVPVPRFQRSPGGHNSIWVWVFFFKGNKD